jgi:hypothetical protein
MYQIAHSTVPLCRARKLRLNCGRGPFQGRVPQTLCNLERGNLNIGPPADLVAAMMQPLVMFAAQRHRVLIADFTAERSRLRELQMMRVTRCPLTNQAWLRRDKGKVRLISLASGLAQGRH